MFLCHRQDLLHAARQRLTCSNESYATNLAILAQKPIGAPPSPLPRG